MKFFNCNVYCLAEKDADASKPNGVYVQFSIFKVRFIS